MKKIKYNLWLLKEKLIYKYPCTLAITSGVALGLLLITIFINLPCNNPRLVDFKEPTTPTTLTNQINNDNFNYIPSSAHEINVIVDDSIVNNITNNL